MRLGGIARNMMSNKEGVLDQKENKLNSLSFQRKWRNHGYMPYVETLIIFFHISGASKSVFAIHFKLINILKGLGRWMSLKASAVPSIFAWKQISPRKRPPPTERPYNDTKEWGNLSQKKSFSVSLEPSAAKHQQQQVIIALSRWISLALQIKCCLFVHFFATFKTLS